MALISSVVLQRCPGLSLQRVQAVVLISAEKPKLLTLCLVTLSFHTKKLTATLHNRSSCHVCRILYINCCQILWSAYLSNLSAPARRST